MKHHVIIIRQNYEILSRNYMTADISASADKFLCLADAFEAGLLFWRRWAHSAHILAVVLNSSV